MASQQRLALTNKLLANGLVLIDGDNVRGKTRFAQSKEDLMKLILSSCAAASNHHDAKTILYYDHGPTADAFLLENRCAVVLSGPSKSADDALTRDIKFFLQRNPSLSVVTSDVGLVIRCRRAARQARGHLDIIRPADLIDVLGDPPQSQPKADSVTTPLIFDLAQRLSSSASSSSRLKRVRPVTDEELLSIPPDASVCEAIAACGGRRDGKEATWERILSAAALFASLQSRQVVQEEEWFHEFREHTRHDARMIKQPRLGARVKATERWHRQNAPCTRPNFQTLWPGGWLPDYEAGFLTVAALRKREPSATPIVVPHRRELRIAVTSDTHGLRRLEQEDHADLLIHAGDFVLESRDRNKNMQALHELDEWISNFAAALVARGNHDPLRIRWSSENTTRYATRPGLYDVVCGDCTLRVLVSPHGTYRAMEAVADTSDHPIDIVVSHSPPAGALDVTYAGRSVGSKALRCGLEKHAPVLWICGHIHESAGAMRLEEGTVVLNAAAANPGRANRIVRPYAVVNVVAAEDKRDSHNHTEPQMKRTTQLLLAIDLGLKNVGVAVVDHNRLLAYATGPDAASCVSALRLDTYPSHIVAEGPRGLRDQALLDLQCADLVASDTADLYVASDWRLDLLLRKECKSQTSAKQAAKLLAEQFIARSRHLFQTPPLEASNTLSIDAAEAICLAFWATANLGWTPLTEEDSDIRPQPGSSQMTGLVRRFTNGHVMRPPHCLDR